MGKLTTLDYIALTLVIIGGLNWGFVGTLDFNLVTTVFGAFPMVVTTTYALIGVASLYVGYMMFGKK